MVKFGKRAVFAALNFEVKNFYRNFIILWSEPDMAEEVDVSVENLSFAYGAEEELALENVNLEARRGELVLITGPSGAGKTTLCRCINGLIPHFFVGTMKGKVLVKGVDTRKTSIALLASKVGTVLQDPSGQLVSPTVEDEIAFGLENFGYPREVIEERVEHYLRFARLEKYRDRNPHTLSGGEQQACALASVLAVEPEILVLDEPTSNLDPIGSHHFFQLFNQLAREKQKTIIVVEHKLDELIPIADKLVVIHRGKVILSGSPRKLLKDAKRMNQLGLKVPDVALLFALLHGKGLEVEEYPMTVDEAYEKIVKILEERGIKAKKVAPAEEARVGKEAAKAGEPIIKVRGLWHVYPGGVEALRGVDLEIRKGEFVAILGQNGSGKTTLVKHFNGLLKPTKGEVIVYGMDTREVPVSRLARLVGYVFQNPDHQIFSRTVKEELAFGPKNFGLSPEEIDERVVKAAKTMGIEEYLDDNPFDLSWGIRQKVAVASILSMEPEVLIVDEPTTGQDYGTSKEMMETFKRLNEEGKTVVIITHDMKLAAEYVDRVVVMKEGKILVDGDTRTVFSNVEVLKEAYLAPPQITQLAIRLREYGAPVALTVEELVDYLAGLLGLGGG